MKWLRGFALLLVAGCVPHLSGAPCHTDGNCPVNQYCNGTTCQSGAPPPTRVLQILVTTPAGILPLGASVQATATAVLQSGAQQDVTASATWSTTNALVAQVSNDAGTTGDVLALATGEVDVDATLGATAGSVHLVVTNAELVSLAVTVDRPVVAPRSDVSCTATGFFTDGTHADLTSLAAWTSTQPGVVTVSNAPGSVGALTALSTGTAEISATYQQLSGSSGIAVTDATLLGLSISPLVPWVATGTTAALSATGIFSDGSAQPMTGSVQWSVDDPSLAFFLASVSGEVEGFSAGMTAVEARAGSLVAAASLLVSDAPLTTLEVSPPLPDPLGVGGASAFTAWGTFADDGVLELTTQSAWSSTNPQILAVLPSSGAASALDGGVASVEVAFGASTASATQSVDAAPAVALLSWPPSVALTVGLPAALAAERVLSDGSVDDATAWVGWASSCPVQLQVTTGASGGALVARSPKTCSVTARFAGLSTSTAVVSTSRLVQRLEVTPPQVAIGPGGWVALNATAIFTDGTEEDVTSLAAWTAGPENVVTAGNGPQAGQALAADAGTTQLIASFGSASASAAVTVVTQSPALELWPPLMQLHAGVQRQLSATAVWPSGDAIDVTPWTVFHASTSALLEVSNAPGRGGLLSALRPGTAVVTADFDLVPASASVSVDTVSAQTLALFGPATLPAGQQSIFQATAQFADGSQADVSPQAAWTSSALDFFRLRGTGPLRGTAVALGVGTAEAHALFSGVSGTAPVEISKGGPQSLSIQALPPSLPSGVRQQLRATANFPDGVQQDVTSGTIWTSLSPEVATLFNGPQAGILETRLPGTAQVTATYEGTQTNATLNVSAAVLTAVTLLPTGPTAPVGIALPLQAMGMFSDGTQVDLTRQARWLSATPGVLATSNGPQTRGNAMGLLAGSTLLSATVTRPDGTSATGSATFVVGAAVPVGVVVSPTNVTLSLSSAPSVLLQATARLSDGSTRPVSGEVTWSVASSEVATVTAAGELTATSTGITTVFATLGGIVGSAAVQVTP